MDNSTFPILDLSLGNQVATNWVLRQTNELERCINGTFHKEIGSVVVRNGYEGVSTNTHSKPVKDVHVARFDSGPVVMRAINNSGGTATLVQRLDGSNWVDLATDLPVDAEVNFTDYRNEVFIGGYSPTADEFVTPLNIDEELGVSEDRNLLFAPKARQFVEFQGTLWAVNVEIGDERYPDRFYKSSAPTETITTINVPVNDTVTEIQVGSARYLKTGMKIDIYKAETDTLVTNGEGIEILGVNRREGIITIASTTLELERLDEVYLTGGKETRSTFWNTDFPTRDTADFARIRSGAGNSNSIIHAQESQNRLILFTPFSTIKYDGANIVPIKDTVGTASGRTIKNVEDSWLIWLDGDGKIQAHHEGEGQSQSISRAVQKYLDEFPVSSRQNAIAIEEDNLYKLSISNGDEHWRFVYDFDGNSWAIEKHLRPILGQFTHTESDSIDTYFFDDEGELYKDNVGHTDNGSAIPLEIVVGDKNLMTEKRKVFKGLWIYSRKAIGTKVGVSIDFGQFLPVGEIREPVERISFPLNEKFKGDLINISLTNSTSGEGVTIDGIIVAFGTEEDNFRARRR